MNYYPWASFYTLENLIFVRLSVCPFVRLSVCPFVRSPFLSLFPTGRVVVRGPVVDS